MIIVCSDNPLPTQIKKSIFLAGPSPRDEKTPDWRQEAVVILTKIGFDGTVFIPQPKAIFEKSFEAGEWISKWNYDNQVEWECDARAMADVIMFWVPRDEKNGMPAFTTNIEFGEDLSSGKMVYGRPDTAERCRYLDKRCELLGLPIYKTLEETIQESVERVEEGSERTGGECQVPLFVWKSEPFKQWYKDLKDSGNRLDGARLLHHIKMQSGGLFSTTLSVNVWVEAEKRHKPNEVVFSRKDISSVVAFYKGETHTSVVLVKEFRSPVRNKNGCVYELPGGSSNHTTDPKIEAAKEFHEECGLEIKDVERFQYVNSRQLMGTFSSHYAHVFKVELTKDEFDSLVQASMLGLSYGERCESGGGELTYVLTVSLDSLHKYPIDYTTVGMIAEACGNAQS